MMKKVVENFREYMQMWDDQELAKVVYNLPLDELLQIWQTLDEQEAIKVFQLLPLGKKVDLIKELPISHQEWLIKAMSIENIKVILEKMDPDDVVDLIQAVSLEAREAVWNSLTLEAKQETQFLLRFDEDDAAGLMTPRYVAIRSSVSVGQALHIIRSGAKDVETVYYIYVVDQLKRLLGVVSLRDLLCSPDDENIDNLMIKDVVYVREETDQEEVAKRLEAYDFIALPVLDRFNRLLGIITFDDVIDVIREEQTEDIYKMGAMDGAADRYIGVSVFRLVKKRIPWLILLLLAGTITTNVLDSYQPVFATAAFLVWFVPVITQTGGNCGTQSSTLMIRGIATGEIYFRDIWKVLLKEIGVGLLMGIGLGILIILRSVLLPPGVEYLQGAIIGISLVFVVMFSSIVGILAPLIIHKLGFDPTVIASPLMATIIDVAGLSIYFETAKFLLHL